MPSQVIKAALSRAISGSDNTVRFSSKMSLECLSSPYPKSKATEEKGVGWKIQAALPLEGAMARVSVFLASPTTGGMFLLQDPPNGRASLVTIGQTRPDSYPAGSPPPASAAFASKAYIWSECHHSYGQMWDPSLSVPAEAWYYDSGIVHCAARYQRGKLGSPSPSIPCFMSFWANGSPQVVEFGSQGQGRHRPLEEGPAYVEFFPNGVPALEIFTSLDESNNPRPVKWQCRHDDNSTREPLVRDIRFARSKLVAWAAMSEPTSAGPRDPTSAFFIRHGSPDTWPTSRPSESSPSLLTSPPPLLPRSGPSLRTLSRTASLEP